MTFNNSVFDSPFRPTVAIPKQEAKLKGEKTKFLRSSTQRSRRRLKANEYFRSRSLILVESSSGLEELDEGESGEDAIGRFEIRSVRHHERDRLSVMLWLHEIAIL